MTVGAINAISGYSGVTWIRPMNYQVKNTSEYSDEYNESVQRVGNTDKVGAVRPVQYPSAQRSDKVEKKADARKMESALNKLAASYENSVTGYASDGAGSIYGVVGANFDMYA